MLGQPLFPGESGIDQLVEIIKVLGTPTRDQIRTMNPNYMEHKFPQIKPHPFSKVCCANRHQQLRAFYLHLPGVPKGRSKCDRFDLQAARVHTYPASFGYRCYGTPLLR